MVGSSDTVEAMNGSGEAAHPATDYYVWQVPGKPVAIHLRFEVVDRLMLEVMRGFGAVPRRGAEVGGVLLGHAQEGDPTAVYVDDFEPVACEYRHGPTYQLSEQDLVRFDEALNHWRPELSPTMRPVGFYRSNTREQLALTEDDLALLNSRFPSASDVILQIKPFATRVSLGGFFFREGDSIQTESSYLEFPFRRKDLGDDTASRPRRQNREEVPPLPFPEPSIEPEWRPDPASPLFGQPPGPAATGSGTEQAGKQPLAVTPEPSGKKTAPKSNVWIPLSFIFLLLGIVLGFQTAITTRIAPAGGAANPYALGLRLTRDGHNIHIRWDRSSPAIRAARRGVLSITDGSMNKNVDLDAATLQNGSVIYRHLSDSLSFRLEAYPAENTSVAESVQASMDRIPAEMPSRPQR